jgi:hypothetical protein
MSSVIEVQSAVIPYIRLVLNDVDDKGNPTSKEYKLVYDYRAIARAEQSLGIDLKSFEAWKHVTSAMTPQLVMAGLAKYHPDVTLDEVMDGLNPAAQRSLHDALIEYLFPGITEAVKKFQAETNKPKNAESEASASV